MRKFLAATGLALALAFSHTLRRLRSRRSRSSPGDTTSFYWQIVLAGARQAGMDLGVNVQELGAQSEADINGQIGILENAVSSNPAAVVISPPNSRPWVRRSPRRRSRSRSSASTVPRTARPSPPS